MGKVVRNFDRNPKLTQAFKKVYVITKNQKVDPYLNSPI